MNKGKISQVIGPVVDVEFTGELPMIYDALEIKLNKNEKFAENSPAYTRAFVIIS